MYLNDIGWGLLNNNKYHFQCNAFKSEKNKCCFHKRMKMLNKRWGGVHEVHFFLFEFIASLKGRQKNIVR